ncbi:MAG: MBL fold metallo-hydrolase [Gemmatimonadota bacterium]
MIDPIDLRVDGIEGAIGVWVLEGPEPALIDPGPSTCLGRLEEGLAERGLTLSDLARVYLTHIHLDHAGVTGHLVRRVPGLEVVVHEEGAPHLVDPDRLVASTRRTFGASHDRLWGEVLPVPVERIRAWAPGGPSVGALRAVPSPGHIAHHLAWLDEETGTLYSGDALGILLAPGAPVHPPTPPPSLDAAAWQRTLGALAALGAERAAAAHFGVHADPAGRARELAAVLDALLGRVQHALRTGDAEAGARYEREVRDRLAPFTGRERVERYFDAFRAETDWNGVVLHLQRLARARAEGAS